MELIGVFLNYQLFVNYNVSCYEEDWDEREISNTVFIRLTSLGAY